MSALQRPQTQLPDSCRLATAADPLCKFILPVFKDTAYGAALPAGPVTSPAHLWTAVTCCMVAEQKPSRLISCTAVPVRVSDACTPDPPQFLLIPDASNAAQVCTRDKVSETLRCW